MATRRSKSGMGAADAQTAKDSLIEIEDHWMAQRLRGESDTTERLLADNFQGGTSDGLVQSKADFLQFIRDGHGIHESAQHLHRHIELHGQTAISTGVVALKSGNREQRFRYLRVFVNDDNEWRLIASQSARLKTS
jgi:hypothetical protein